MTKLSNNNDPIRVAVIYDKFAKLGGGGARESLLTLLDGLAKNIDLIVDAYQSTPINDRPDTNYKYSIHTHTFQKVPALTWTNEIVLRWQWRNYLRQILSDRDYTFIFTQTNLAPAAITVAKEENIPSVNFFRSMALATEKYNPKQTYIKSLLSTDWGGRIQFPFVVKNFQEHQKSVRNASLTIANSKYTANEIQNVFNVESHVIYPPINIKKYHVDYDPEGYITMVNPRAKYKGPDIFLDIAAAQPDENFLLAGSLPNDTIRHQAEELSNVTHWGWCEDMREVYSNSKIIVVPSRWEEPFGRVPAEAMVSGIPVVVSKRGGLPEVVGNTAPVVDEVESLDAWLMAIKNAFDNHDPLAQQEQVQKFSVEHQVEKLVQLLNSENEHNI